MKYRDIIKYSIKFLVFIIISSFLISFTWDSTHDKSIQIPPSCLGTISSLSDCQHDMQETMQKNP